MPWVMPMSSTEQATCSSNYIGKSYTASGTWSDAGGQNAGCCSSLVMREPEQERPELAKIRPEAW